MAFNLWIRAVVPAYSGIVLIVIEVIIGPGGMSIFVEQVAETARAH